MDPPTEIDDKEKLNRRIFPDFINDDGSVSSQAFRDSEMSVDRASYRTLDETLESYDSYGCAELEAKYCRSLDQEVVASPELLNPAHAQVNGKKTKAIARKLAKNCRRLR